jgi:tRNA threonylcarbamoyladenosine biosynthesis protein TsaB
LKILAIDTSTNFASIAVTEGEEVLSESCLTTGKKRGEVVVPAIDQMLKDLSLKPADIDAYVIALGPGSFTGLRTTLAFVKGLVLANERPLKGVSSLEVLAMNGVDSDLPVLPVIDAKKSQVYTALFKPEKKGLSRESDDYAISPERLLEIVKEKTLVLGDGLEKFKDEILGCLGDLAVSAPPELWGPKASNAAIIALPDLLDGKSDPIDQLVPVYVRNTDAELKLGARK